MAVVPCEPHMRVRVIRPSSWMLMLASVTVESMHTVLPVVLKPMLYTQTSVRSIACLAVMSMCIASKCTLGRYSVRQGKYSFAISSGANLLDLAGWQWEGT